MPLSMIEELTRDHRRFNLAISRIQQQVLDTENHYFSEGRKPEKTAIVLKLVSELLAELHRHEELERRSVYPELLHNLPELRDAVAEIELEHRGLDATTEELHRIVRGERAANNREIARRVVDLLVLLRSHMRDEERLVFSPARRAVKEAV